ncbi:MAG: ABC-2 family transporter protein, partial [Candidatus Cybelea sp.]
GRIVFALPFASIYSTPLLIYIGIIPPSQWAASIAAQVAWLALFAALSSLVWRAASNRVVIQGG